MQKQEVIDALECYKRNTAHILGDNDEKVKTIETCIMLVEEIEDETPNTSNTLNALDTISRQAAIDAVKDLLDSMLETDTIGFYEIEHALFEVPSAQPEITQEDVELYCRRRCLTLITDDLYNEMKTRWSAQQWTLISERKPERCDYYLVTDSGLAGEAYYGSDRRWWADGNKLKDVTAWMPLPEPYKEDKA